MIRILILFFLLSTFAYGKEGEVREEIRIYITDYIYIKPELILDTNNIIDYSNTVQEEVKVVTSIVIEF